MNTHPASCDLVFEPVDNERLANLCGPLGAHLRQLEGRLGVEITNRGNRFQIIGGAGPVKVAQDVLKGLYAEARDRELTPARVHLLVQEAGGEDVSAAPEGAIETVGVQTRRGLVKARGTNQSGYLRAIRGYDISFGVGPAGTGKTYLAVACAVEALEQEKVSRIILTRPAVEAGERLGFLPGDLVQKIDPYLRPLHDALYEMLGFERVAKLMERSVIEIAPLAYMRGRTLNEAFIILDEAQNTTVEQMKMFLTRIGFGSKVVVTGDVTQVDLPRERASGLRHVVEVLKDVEGISFTFFSARDVVRHPLVQSIVRAYEAYEDQGPNPDQGKTRGRRS